MIATMIPMTQMPSLIRRTDDNIDLIDQSCDGLDGPDLDGDGFVDSSAGGDDCNMTPTQMPFINPDISDIPNNGIDEDLMDWTVRSPVKRTDLGERLGHLVIRPQAVGDSDGEWFSLGIQWAHPEPRS